MAIRLIVGLSSPGRDLPPGGHGMSDKSGMHRTADLGLTDKHSWIGRYTNHTTGAALPVEGQYRLKPAYHALKQALAEQAAHQELITKSLPPRKYSCTRSL
jgi:hypothetical protein